MDDSENNDSCPDTEFTDVNLDAFDTETRDPSSDTLWSDFNPSVGGFWDHPSLKKYFEEKLEGKPNSRCSCSSDNDPTRAHLESASSTGSPTWSSINSKASLEELLHQIYRVNLRRPSSVFASDSECSTPSERVLGQRSDGKLCQKHYPFRKQLLNTKDIQELHLMKAGLTYSLSTLSLILLKELKKKDKSTNRRNRNYDVITAILIALSEKRSQDTRMRFSVEPLAGDSGFVQWRDAMKMCSRLPGGIPPEFRRRMWLTLAEQYVRRRKICWKEVERTCFHEWASPDDEGLGDQIVKDLHRTGCSLFCGVDAQVNQALLKRVLLGFARWNKAVGYCQGFNMLAAIILEVMDRQEADALKVMIYLIEEVLPESYFANNLRGLSVDMAVFRDLMKEHLPVLSRHLESLQQEASDQATGACYEPPLTNVFTMQWFLTLFSNCLPRDAVMRVWDLTFLHGDEMLLRTALAIWGRLSSRILEVKSADEFYTVMGILTRELLTHGLMDGNHLVKTLIGMAPFPFPGLAELRDKYTYNITPWTQSVSSVAKKGLRIFYLDDDEEEEEKTDETHQTLAVAAAFGIVGLFKKGGDQRGTSPMGHLGPNTGVTSSVSTGRTSPVQAIGSVRSNLDISALKKQYTRLRERQKQAHIILTGSQIRSKCDEIKRPSLSQSQKATTLSMKHLLRGKKALTSKTKRVVHQGVIPNIMPRKKQVERKVSDSTGVKQKSKTDKLQKINSSAYKPQSKANNTLRLPLIPPKTKQSVDKPQLKIISETQNKIPEKVQTKSESDTLHWKDTPRRARRASLPYGVKFMEASTGSKNLPDIKDDDGDGSSTSTELCDDDDDRGELSEEDHTPAKEPSRPFSTSPRLENRIDYEENSNKQNFTDNLDNNHKCSLQKTKVNVEKIDNQCLEKFKSTISPTNVLSDIKPSTANLTLDLDNSLISDSHSPNASTSLSSPTKWKWSFSKIESIDRDDTSPVLSISKLFSKDETTALNHNCPSEKASLSPIENKHSIFSYLFEIADVTKIPNDEEKSQTFQTDSDSKSDKAIVEQDGKLSIQCPLVLVELFNEDLKLETETPSNNNTASISPNKDIFTILNTALCDDKIPQKDEETENPNDHTNQVESGSTKEKWRNDVESVPEIKINTDTNNENQTRMNSNSPITNEESVNDKSDSNIRLRKVFDIVENVSRKMREETEEEKKDTDTYDVLSKIFNARFILDQTSNEYLNTVPEKILEYKSLNTKLDTSNSSSTFDLSVQTSPTSFDVNNLNENETSRIPISLTEGRKILKENKNNELAKTISENLKTENTPNTDSDKTEIKLIDNKNKCDIEKNEEVSILKDEEIEINPIYSTTLLNVEQGKTPISTVKIDSGSMSENNLGESSCNGKPESETMNTISQLNTNEIGISEKNSSTLTNLKINSPYFSDVLKYTEENKNSNLPTNEIDKAPKMSDDLDEITSEIIRRRLWAGVKSMSLDTNSIGEHSPKDASIHFHFPSLPTLEESPSELIAVKENEPHCHHQDIAKLQKRRNSEAAIKLVKENTQIIDKILKQRGAESVDEIFPITDIKHSVSLEFNKEQTEHNSNRNKSKDNSLCQTASPTLLCKGSLDVDTLPCQTEPPRDCKNLSFQNTQLTESKHSSNILMCHSSKKVPFSKLSSLTPKNQPILINSTYIQNTFSITSPPNEVPKEQILPSKSEKT